MPKVFKESDQLKERMTIAKRFLPDRATNIYFHQYPPSSEEDRQRVYQVFNNRTTDKQIVERFERIVELYKDLGVRLHNS